MDIDNIREMLRRSYTMATRHFQERLDEREITLKQVKQAIFTGRIVEERPKQHPHPECLIVGEVDCKIPESDIVIKVPLFVMCALGNDLYLITADWKMPREWGQKRKIRRG